MDRVGRRPGLLLGTGLVALGAAIAAAGGALESWPVMLLAAVAYGAAAVPETLGGAGVTFAPKDLEYAAELLGDLVYDRPFRAGVIAGQRERVRAFHPSQIEPRIHATLAGVGLTSGSGIEP